MTSSEPGALIVRIASRVAFTPARLRYIATPSQTKKVRRAGSKPAFSNSRRKDCRSKSTATRTTVAAGSACWRRARMRALRLPVAGWSTSKTVRRRSSRAKR